MPSGYIRNLGEEIWSVTLLEHDVQLVWHRQLHPEEHLTPHWEQLLDREIVVVVDIVSLIGPEVAETGLTHLFPRKTRSGHLL